MNATARIHLLGVMAGDLAVRPSARTDGITAEVGRGADTHVILSFADADYARAFFNAGLEQLDALPAPAALGATTEPEQ